VTEIVSDPDTLVFAKGKNVTFQFTLKDAGTVFYLGFVDGKVSAGLGEPPAKADVNIKTDTATLDGMFTGRLDGTAAFKAGKLSVGGNMMKAMVMQKLNMGALWGKARLAYGNPDFTTSTATPAAPPAAAASAAPAASTPVGSAPALVDKVGDIRDEILEINNWLYGRGWITSTGGNISARSEHNPHEIWITPGSIFKGNLQADMMVKIDIDGNQIGAVPYNASSERRVHCAIYRCRPEIKTVIHTHALYSTLMALTGTKWQPVSADAAFFGEIPVVPFIMPGSPELGEEVAQAMGLKGYAAIMQNHGLVVAGTELRRAADLTEMIEVVAEKLLWCRKLGIDPIVLPDEIADMLKEMGSAIA
jgi:autoinducer 2 (AI-2) kinase